MVKEPDIDTPLLDILLDRAEELEGNPAAESLDQLLNLITESWRELPTNTDELTRATLPAGLRFAVEESKRICEVINKIYPDQQYGDVLGAFKVLVESIEKAIKKT